MAETLAEFLAFHRRLDGHTVEQIAPGAWACSCDDHWPKATKAGPGHRHIWTFSHSTDAMSAGINLPGVPVDVFECACGAIGQRSRADENAQIRVTREGGR